MQAHPAVQAVAAQESIAIRYGRPVGRFALAFAEMCVAMCAGGLVLNFVFFQGAAQIGYPNFFQRNFLISVLVLGVNWALAMGIYMTVRGHPLRHNLEMSSTSIVAALGLIAAYSALHGKRRAPCVLRGRGRVHDSGPGLVRPAAVPVRAGATTAAQF